MTTSLEFVSVAPTGAVDSCVIWMHGLGADGHDFEPLVPELALPNTQFIFPHAPVRPVTINGGLEMRAWYDFITLDFSTGENYSHIHESLLAIKNLMAQVSTETAVPSSRVVLAGFSQGGVMALLGGLSSGDRYAGILALSTYLPAATLKEPLSCQTILQCHGTQDPVIPISVGEETAKRLGRSCPGQLEFKVYPMAHQLCAQEVADIRNWLHERLS